MIKLYLYYNFIHKIYKIYKKYKTNKTNKTNKIYKIYITIQTQEKKSTYVYKKQIYIYIYFNK